MSEPAYVTFDTSVGSFTVELYTAHAPKVSCRTHYTDIALTSQTCNNFAKLAERGYYNGVIFHRIIPVSLAIFQLSGIGELGRDMTRGKSTKRASLR